MADAYSGRFSRMTACIVAASLKVGDYAAYERQARRALGTFIAADPGHNPPPIRTRSRWSTA